MSSSPYSKASELLNKIWTSRVSLKSLAYDKKGSPSCSKATYAQVCNVLNRKATLDALLEAVPIEAQNQGLLYVLLYELIFGPHQSIRGGGALKRSILQKEANLRDAANLSLEQGTTPKNNQIESFPRYIRVNTLRVTAEEVIEHLKLLKVEHYADPHVPNLLVIPPSKTTDLLQDQSLAGKIVLQDKSSCFSALCLLHGFSDGHALEEGVEYLDACAAPGNKTTHLAALLASHSATKGKTTTIHAFDRDTKRLAILRKRAEELVPEDSPVFIMAKNEDFLTAQPAEYSKVGAILLDPSCSGSGIFTALDRQADSREESDHQQRLEALSSFQLKALKHAMTFPSVRRITYSTCSLHVEENEQVVAKVLADARDEWHLIAPLCLSSWKRRGIVVDGITPEEASCLIRADRGDETNGFFVACFSRRRLDDNKCESIGATSLQKAVLGEAEPVSHGVSFYQRQFSTAVIQNAAQPEPASSKKRPAPDLAQEASLQSSKKRMKKLEWKRKQREQKLDRVKRKQDSRP